MCLHICSEKVKLMKPNVRSFNDNFRNTNKVLSQDLSSSSKHALLPTVRKSRAGRGCPESHHCSLSLSILKDPSRSVSRGEQGPGWDKLNTWQKETDTYIVVVTAPNNEEDLFCRK